MDTISKLLPALVSQVVSNIVPFAVHMANPTLGPSPIELDMAYMQARSVRTPDPKARTCGGETDNPLFRYFSKV